MSLTLYFIINLISLSHISNSDIFKEIKSQCGPDKEHDYYAITLIAPKGCVSCNVFRLDNHLEKLKRLTASKKVDVLSITIITNNDSVQASEINQLKDTSFIKLYDEGNLFVEFKKSNKIKYNENYFAIFNRRGKIIFQSYLRKMDGVPEYNKLFR
jgi:hypothetical protein